MFVVAAKILISVTPFKAFMNIIKIGDVVVPGATTDFEGYIFALDTFNDRSGYIPVSVLSA